MDYEAWRFWFTVGQFLLTALVWLYVWLSNRDRVTNKRFIVLEKKMDQRLDSHTERITLVEAACNHAPSHKDLGAVYDRVNEMSKEVSKLAGGMVSLQNSVDMIHEHLLKSGGQ